MSEGATSEHAASHVGSTSRVRSRVGMLVGLAALAAAVAAALPPIAQDPHYHAFADTRAVGAVPNFWNVVSNVGFAVVGALGVAWVMRHARPRPDGPFVATWEVLAGVVLFTGVLLTGVGSAYYHLAPDNARLVWDRLPMTLAFMPLFALVIGDRIDPRAGRLALVPLILVGVGSVVTWHLGEQVGHGDLRLYALVQFFPMLVVPLMLVSFPARFTGVSWLWATLALYAAAKACEVLDAPILAAGGIVSGHTLKHLLSALATASILVMLARRRPRDSRQ